MNIPLLHRLRGAEGAFVPVAALGGAESVRRDVDELIRFGFGLEWHPYRGVAYRGPATALCPDQIEWELGTRRIGQRIAVWSRVASTNDLASAAGGSSANDGLVVLAEEQTAGRGRLGRAWQAPRGSSILMSVLLFPPPRLDSPRVLTALGAVAVAEVAESWLGRPATIKWPNDVRIGGRKLAGILVERGAGCVIGIGLNTNLERDAFPPSLRPTATSLSLELGLPVDRSELARELIRNLDRLYDATIADGGVALDAAWSARLEAVGRRVRVETPDGAMAGRLEIASLSQGVLLCDDTGQPITLPAEVVLDLRIDDNGAPSAAAPPPAGAKSSVSTLAGPGVDC